jgi:lipopolysaccharide export system permease protein
VLSIIDRYLLRQIVATCLVMTGIGLTILLLERVLYLFSLVADPNNALGYVGQMLLLLTPHYLSIALPAAFFFGVLLTFGRLKQDGEFIVLMAAGRGVGRLLAPVLGLALVMTAIAALILGFINPHAQYAYRALKHTVAQASLTAAVLEGTFIQADGLTFFAEHSAVGPAGLELQEVFVHQNGEDGETIVVTGRNGRLTQSPEDGRPVLMLEQGVRAEIPEGAGADALTFRNLSWPVDTENEVDTPSIVRILVGVGADIESVSHDAPRLEDVYLRLLERTHS